MKCCCKVPLREILVQKTRVEVCPRCGLLTKMDTISFEEERRRYDEHHWDENYKKYMETVFHRIFPYLQRGISLDYGCGKIHQLADLCNENHYPCDYYDLHYFPVYPKKNYDTILLIEVFEHLREPYNELLKLRSLLKEKGRIIILTKPYDNIPLDKWWYFRDKTHISFLMKNTLSLWDIGLNLILNTEDIFVLERI